jgi:hypothetical protein
VRNGRIDIGSFEVQTGSTRTPTPTSTPSSIPHSQPDTNGDSHSYRNGNCDRHSNADFKSYTNATTSPHSGAQALIRVVSIIGNVKWMAVRGGCLLAAALHEIGNNQ